MRGRRLDRVVKFDIGQLGAANNALLYFGGKRIPAFHVVQVFLHDDIAAAGKGAVLGADKNRIERSLIQRILRSIDKAEEIAFVEKAKAMHFIEWRNGVSEPAQDLGRQFETKVRALGADVEHQIAGRRGSMTRAGLDLAERMQFGRAGL